MEILTVDYQVQLIQLPSNKTKELGVLNEDGSYTIFIEASLSREEQKKAFNHAMKHILEDDFAKDDINKIEKAAHNTELSSELCTV